MRARLWCTIGLFSLTLNLWLASQMRSSQPAPPGIAELEYCHTTLSRGMFTVRFTSDMAEADQLPVVLTPAVAVVPRWQDERTLLLLTDSRPPPDTTFQIQPLETAQDAGGIALAQVPRAASTPPFRIVSVESSTTSSLAGGRVTYADIVFSSPVDSKQLLAHLQATPNLKDCRLSSKTNAPSDHQRIGIGHRADVSSIELCFKKGLQAVGAARGLDKDRRVTIPIKPQQLELPAPHVGWIHAKTYGDGFRLELKVSKPTDAQAFVDQLVFDPPAEVKKVYSWGRTVSIVGNFRPRCTYEITFPEGLVFSDDVTPLAAEAVRTFTTPDRPAQVRFLSRGPFLPLEPQASLPLYVGNTGGVELSAMRVYPNNIVQFLRSDRVRDVGRTVAKYSLVPELDENQEARVTVPLSDLLGGQKPGIYMIDAFPTAQRYRLKTRRVVLTKIGLSVAQQDQTLHAVAFSLDAHEPLSNCTLSVYSERNQLLGSGNTGSDGVGIVRLQPLDDEKPYVLIGERDGDLSYLLLDGKDDHRLTEFSLPGRTLPASEYEALVFHERGVCRPGEELRIQALVRDSALRAASGFPCRLRIEDPLQRVLLSIDVDVDTYGWVSHTLPVADAAVTGRYQVSIGAPDGSVWGSSSFRVAHYVPDTMRTDLELDGPIRLDQPITATVRGRYYFGAAASDCEATFSCYWQAAAFAPPGYEDFQFGDADRSWNSSANERKVEQTDPTGLAHAELAIPDELTPPAALRATIIGTVAEPGGRTVAARHSEIVHPVPYYIGLATPAGDDPPHIPWRAVSATGSPYAAGTLHWTLSRRTWRYALSYDDDGDIVRDWSQDDELVREGELQPGLEAGKIELTDLTGGHYQLLMRDDENLVQSRRSFWHYRGQDSSRTTHPAGLVIETDRPTYEPGTTARLQFLAPTAGSAFIVTSARQIDHSQAVPVQAGLNTVEVPIPQTALGSVYAAVTVVHERSGDALVPRRLFGLAHLMVNQSKHQLDIKLSHEAEAKPGETLAVAVSLSHDAAVQLYAVDQGILALSGYRTPAPHSFFYGPRRCGARFADMFDSLFPDTPADFATIAALGGGGRMGRGSIRPDLMDPAIVVLPPVSLTAGTHTIQVPLPDHSGELRLIAVGAGDDVVGATDSTLVTRTPLTIRLSAPRAVAPGDTFTVTATIFNHGDTAGTCELRNKLNGRLLGESAPATSVELSAHGEHQLTWQVEALDCGPAAILLAGNLLGTVTRARVPLVVRPASEAIVVLEHRTLEAGDTHTIQSFPDFEPDTYRCDVSAGPAGATHLNVIKHMLDDYPYGCLEQTTSRALAALALHQLEPKMEIQDRVDAAVARLQQLARSNGAFGMWPGATRDWTEASIYACQFLVGARQAGCSVDTRLYDDALKWLRFRVLYTDRRLSEGFEGYAHLVLALADQAVPTRALDVARHPGSPYDQALAALALIRAGHQQPGKTALESLDLATIPAGKGELNSPVRRQALLLWALLTVKPDHHAIPALFASLEGLRVDGHWGNTHNNALGAMALSAWNRQYPPQSGTITTVSGEDRQVGAQVQTTLGPDEACSVSTTSPALIAIRHRGIPLEPESGPRSRGMSITRTYLDADGEPVLAPRQGDRVCVRITLSSDQAVRNVVAVDLLPGGLEIEDPSLDTRWHQPRGEARPYGVRYHELLDDRVILYLDLQAERPMTFEYWTRAVTPGTYSIPRITSEAMYRPDIVAANGEGCMVIQ